MYEYIDASYTEIRLELYEGLKLTVKGNSEKNPAGAASRGIRIGKGHEES